MIVSRVSCTGFDLPFLTSAAATSFSSCRFAFATSCSGGLEYFVRISYTGGIGSLGCIARHRTAWSIRCKTGE